MRELSAALIVFFSVPMAFADPQHWWVLARGTDFKNYDKCVVGDDVASPTQVVAAGKSRGWAAQVDDKGNEVDVNFMSPELSFRWFRTQDACQAAAQANDASVENPTRHSRK